MDKVLKELYYSPKTGYKSAYKMYLKAKEVFPEISRSKVGKFLEKQYSYQVNKQVVKPTVYNTILAQKVGDFFQVDIMIYDRYEINKYKYILVCIDVHSRFAQARAMTNRENKTIIANLKDIFNVMGKPKHFFSDNEFNTKAINEYLINNKIKPVYSEVGEINKNAIVERFNRTLANMIQKWRTATNKYTWYKVLPDFMENYNDTVHRTIKNKPIDVFNGKAKNEQSNIISTNPIFEKGDIVRIKNVKKVLGKGDFIKYSEDTYLIDEKMVKGMY